ncbi:MAG TPA: ABC transporter permease [Acidimicrobiales bacterium]|nr:ABC transporter permease [Acidimicrobiales bacterium]
MGSQSLTAPPPALPPRATRRRPVSIRGSLRELVQARELTVNLVRRDLKVEHRGTFLGMLWSLATPLLLVALYYVVFKFIIGAHPAVDKPRPDGNDVPFALYFFAGLTVWNLFSNSLSRSTTSVTSSGYLLRKVYLPKAILPLASVLSSLVTFAFEFVVLMVAVLLVVGPPSAQLLWAPAIVAVALVMAYGLALLLSAVNVFLRDTAHFIGILLQLWFWATPVIYSLQFVAKNPGVATLLKLNPMTGVVVSLRNVTLLDRGPELGLLAGDLGFALIALAVGAVVFNRSQRLFAELV